jgi:hypothetical protein
VRELDNLRGSYHRSYSKYWTALYDDSKAVQAIPSHVPVVAMDVAVAVSGYVSKIVALGDGAAGSSAKMKILLLDSETVGFCDQASSGRYTLTLV